MKLNTFYSSLDVSPSNCSGLSSPKHRSIYEDAKPSSADSSPKRSRKDNGGGIGSYFKRFGFGRSETSEHSMFYYDNLSSLRASKQPYQDNDKLANLGFNGRNDASTLSSTLSPDSAEFVPASQRINKVVGSNLKKDNSWATIDDSALEQLRPPPGLSRPPPHNIWGLDKEDGWGSSKKKSSLFDYDSEFKSDASSGYSSLLGRSKEVSFGEANLYANVCDYMES